MCGYVCIGCGACGRKKSALFDRPCVCPACGARKTGIDQPCPQCGALLAPGQPGSKAAVPVGGGRP